MDENSRHSDRVWQGATLANAYLDGVRGAIPLAAEQIDVMLRLIRAARPRVGAVLDLGCGDGILGHAILDDFASDNPTVVLADFSQPMLDRARARLAGYENARFVVVDYGDAGWPAFVTSGKLPARYDVVVSGFSIHHQPDARKREIYAEIYDLLAPGGIFLNLEHVASATPWGETLFADYMVDSLYVHFVSKNGETRTRDEIGREYYYRPDKDANILAPLEAQCHWLREVGFTRVDCFLKIFELALFGGVRPA